jgi:hypothetical protein
MIFPTIPGPIRADARGRPRVDRYANPGNTLPLPLRIANRYSKPSTALRLGNAAPTSRTTSIRSAPNETAGAEQPKPD